MQKEYKINQVKSIEGSIRLFVFTGCSGRKTWICAGKERTFVLEDGRQEQDFLDSI